MTRPRLLLVPQLTEIEWVIRPLLEEWADVACYDTPGVGDEPPLEVFGSEAAARRGLDEVDRREWDRFFLVADEFGLAAASRIAVGAPDRIEGVALGHARLSNTLTGERPTVNQEVHEACVSLMRADTRMFVHQLFKMTGGETSAGGYGEDLVAAWLERVPVELSLQFWERREFEGEQIGDRLAQIEAPMFLASHRGCLLFTKEGFDDAVEAFPQARHMNCDEKPSTAPEFAAALREFCAERVRTSA
jgi:hypothetical protein